jgi:hypothetical protein
VGDTAKGEDLLSGAGWRDFCRRLEQLGEKILGGDYSTDPRTRAEGFRALTRLFTYACQLEIEAGDPLFPSFVRLQDPYNQWGGPNPDNVYLRANIDARETYRVWSSDVRGTRQAIFSLHEGDMQLRELGVFSERSLGDCEIAEDGGLELIVSPEEHPGNWLESDPKARILTIRIYQSDWENDAVPSFYIERVGAEGVPRPPLSADALASGLDRAMRWVEASAVFWNQYTRRGHAQATPNVVAPPSATPGGAENILYGSCFWSLADDEALLVSVEQPDADYWSFVTHTLGWLESGDFDQRQTSLNGEQAFIDRDGLVRVVLSARDPGVPNWIDIEGRAEGMLVYRWVWARSKPVPEARVVALSDVRGLVPDEHPVIDDEERRRRLAGRRESLWNRYH